MMIHEQNAAESAQEEVSSSSLDKLPPCLVSTLYTFLPDAASRHALASTSKDVRSAVLHNISKLTVPREQLLACNNVSNNNPLFSFPKSAVLRTLVIEGNALQRMRVIDPLNAGLGEHDCGQLIELLLPQTQDTLRRAISVIMDLRVLELKDVSIGVDDHAIRLGMLMSALPDLQVLRLTRIRSPCIGHFALALTLRDKASSIRELHLAAANDCILNPALPSIAMLPNLTSLSLYQSVSIVEPQPSLLRIYSLQHLKHLSVFGFGGVLGLLEQLPQLKTLKSEHYPYPDLVAVLPPSLTALHCLDTRDSYTEDYTESLNYLRPIQEAVCAQRLPHLRQLVLKQVNFLPEEGEPWISPPDIAQLLVQSMSIPGCAVAIKDVYLQRLDIFASFCSLAPSVAEHIEFIEMDFQPEASSVVRLAETCPNLTGLSFQNAIPAGDLAWLYQALTLFKRLRKVVFSDEPYGVTFPVISRDPHFEGSKLLSVLRASADATRRKQPLELKCSFTMDSIANDDEAFEQRVRHEVKVLEESVEASCATIREPHKQIDFHASVDIALDGIYDVEDFAGLLVAL